MTAKFNQLIWIMGLLGFAGIVYADVTHNDDVIVKGSGVDPDLGSLCIGVDCINGEAFNGDAIRLKENNLRLRFHDTSSTEVMGQGWVLIANDNLNRWRSYFNISIQSITNDQPLISDGSFLLSDGTAPEYDCTGYDDYSNPQPGVPPQTGNSIPQGELVIQPVDHGFVVDAIKYSCGPVPRYPLYDCDQANPGMPRPIESIPAGEPATTPTFTGSGYDCLAATGYSETEFLQLGTLIENGVTLGRDSDFTYGAVSVGKADLLRQLKHVAEGVQETNLLVLGTLTNFSPFDEQLSQLDHLEQTVATLNAQLDTIESDIEAKNDAPTAPILLSPGPSAMGIDPASVTFHWRASHDPEGAELSYTLAVCKQQDLSGCQPTLAQAWQPQVIYSTVGGGLLLLLACFLLPGLRGRIWLRHLVALATLSALLAGCNDGESRSEKFVNQVSAGSLSTTVTGLDPAAEYYWQIGASDGIETTTSEIRKFTTR